MTSTRGHKGSSEGPTDALSIGGGGRWDTRAAPQAQALRREGAEAHLGDVVHALLEGVQDHLLQLRHGLLAGRERAGEHGLRGACGHAAQLPQGLPSQPGLPAQAAPSEAHPGHAWTHGPSPSRARPPAPRGLPRAGPSGLGDLAGSGCSSASPGSARGPDRGQQEALRGCRLPCSSPRGSGLRLAAAAAALSTRRTDVFHSHSSQPGPEKPAAGPPRRAGPSPGTSLTATLHAPAAPTEHHTTAPSRRPPGPAVTESLHTRLCGGSAGAPHPGAEPCELF